MVVSLSMKHSSYLLRVFIELASCVFYAGWSEIPDRQYQLHTEPDAADRYVYSVKNRDSRIVSRIYVTRYSSRFSRPIFRAISCTWRCEECVFLRSVVRTACCCTEIKRSSYIWLNQHALQLTLGQIIIRHTYAA